MNVSTLAYSRHIQLSDSDVQEDDGESWHVLVGGEDVKVLSTDQLADLYRLSIVDDQTLLWQPGMGQWTSLAQVAGLEGEPTGIHAYGELAPVRFNATPHVMPASAPPTAITIAPPPRARGPERWLLGVALVAGLLVSAYRTDALYSVAQAWQQEAAFSAAELAVFGGPTANTPRAVRRFIESRSPTPGAAAPVIPAEWTAPEALSAAAAPRSQTGAARASVKPSAPGGEVGAAPASAAAALAPTPGSASAPTTPFSALAPAAPAAAPLSAAATAERVDGAAHAPPLATRTSNTAPPPPGAIAPSGAARPSGATAKPRRRSTTSEAVIPGLKPGGSEYDPLNSKL